MPIPTDGALYNEARNFIMSKYKKNSAFASGATVKHYKQLFKKKYGEDTPPYSDDDKSKNLKRWFKEKWINVNPVLGIYSDEAYPLFRPTVKVNTKTPTLMQDIPKKRLKEQFELKQKIKGYRNLPEFLPNTKVGGMVVRSFPERPENNGIIV